MKKEIFVTQPYLPPLNEFIPYLEKIWQNKILTNGGEFHSELEKKLCEYLQVEHISLFSNGTIALITALQALSIKGDVITTPYSFVATAHSLLWNGIKPVFVDIDKNTLNIDPNKIEAAITENTSAIMPVHCYGAPCDVDEIEKIANKYNLKVIYDAAHAFGVKCHCGSILNHGDLSVLSFHATKVFNTFEGGAIISKSLEMKKRIDHLKNFGFLNEVTVVEAGINGKMSEINAAFGLLQLKYVQKAIDERRDIDGHYRQELRNVKGISFVAEGIHFERNFSYFPILVGDDYKMTRDQLYQLLKSNGINTRRYFYPIISNFPMYSEFDSAKPELLPEANKAGAQILCLPIYPGLSFDNLDGIINLIK